MADAETIRDERDKNLRVALGKRIRALRTKTGKGQEEFSDLAGIHRNHIGLLERGEIDPRLSTLSRVAEALGLKVSELVSSETD